MVRLFSLALTANWQIMIGEESFVRKYHGITLININRTIFLNNEKKLRKKIPINIRNKLTNFRKLTIRKIFKDFDKKFWNSKIEEILWIKEQIRPLTSTFLHKNPIRTKRTILTFFTRNDNLNSNYSSKCGNRKWSAILVRQIISQGMLRNVRLPIPTHRNYIGILINYILNIMLKNIMNKRGNIVNRTIRIFEHRFKSCLKR